MSGILLDFYYPTYHQGRMPINNKFFPVSLLYYPTHRLDPGLYPEPGGEREEEVETAPHTQDAERRQPEHGRFRRTTSISQTTGTYSGV